MKMQGQLVNVIKNIQILNGKKRDLSSNAIISELLKITYKNNPEAIPSFAEFKQMLTEELERTEDQIINEQLEFIYEPFVQDQWQNEIQLLKPIKNINITDNQDTAETLEKYKNQLQSHISELKDFLEFINQFEPPEDFNERINLQNNLKYLSGYVEQIKNEIKDLDSQIIDLKNEKNHSLDNKRLGIGENILLPSRCVIVYMFKNARQKKILSVPSGGHLAVEVIHDGQSLYFSAIPGELLEHTPTIGEHKLNARLEKLSIPKNLPKEGKFSSKERDLKLLMPSDSPNRYISCEAVILDCSGEAPKIPLDTAKMLQEGKKLRDQSFEYNFWKKNCGDMAMDILRIGGLETIVGKSVPKTFGVTVPLSSFAFVHEVARMGEAYTQFSKPLSIQEKWRYNFGICKSRLLLAINIETLYKPTPNISQAQLFLKQTYEFFNALEEEVISSKCEKIDELQTFLKNAYINCEEKLEILKSLLSTQPLSVDERDCYEQAFTVLIFAANHFSASTQKFLQQESRKLVLTDLSEALHSEFKTMIDNGNYIYDKFKEILIIKKNAVEPLNAMEDFLDKQPYLTDETILLKCLRWESGNTQDNKDLPESEAYRYLIETVKSQDNTLGFIPILALMTEINKALDEATNLSDCEITDSRTFLFDKREKISNLHQMLVQIEKDPGNKVSSVFFKTAKVGLQSILSSINQKIYFELEPDQNAEKRKNLVAHTKAVIMADMIAPQEKSEQIQTYTELRDIFLDSLAKGKYAKFEKIRRADAQGNLVMPGKNEPLEVPSIFKIWRRKERSEILEVKAIWLIIERLQKGQPLNMTHFNNIRPENMNKYKEKAYLIQTIDYFLDGKISDDRLFGVLGLSKKFKEAITALKLDAKPLIDSVTENIDSRQVKKVDNKKTFKQVMVNKFAFAFHRRNKVISEKQNDLLYRPKV